MCVCRLFVAFLPAIGTLVCQTPDTSPVRAAAEEMIGQLPSRHAALIVLRDDGELHRCVTGNLAADVVMPVTTASQWLAAATILSLVDDKQLELDVPIARYLKEFDRQDKRTITLRQCLACTAGVPVRLRENMDGWDMAKFTAVIAGMGLQEHPGSGFRYGGVGLQIAAVAAERASGKGWHDLFAERIATPLGMKQTKFGEMQPPGDRAGITALPWVAAGAVSTIDDYCRFMRMLAGKGRFDGRTVLSEASVTAMCRDQVAANIEVRGPAFDDERVRFGLGTWLQTLADGVVRVTDPGAFGFTPWLDVDLGVGGVFVARERDQKVRGKLRVLQAEVRSALQPPVITPDRKVVALGHAGRERNYELYTPPNAGGDVGLPLLLVLHGGGSSGEQMREATGLADAGVRAGFAVVFPDGTGPSRAKERTWNAGGPASSRVDKVDDVAFLRAVVADVQKRVPIHPARVYAVGHGNGASMCHRLARQAADLFAGIGAVDGPITFTAADASTPIAALLVQSAGGAGRAQQDAADYYVGRNGLAAEPVVSQDGKVRTKAWVTGKNGERLPPVRVVALDGGDRPAPGAKPKGAAGTPFPSDATAAIVAFFAELAPPRVPTPSTPR